MDASVLWICYMLYITIGQLPSPHFTLIRSLLYFVSFPVACHVASCHSNVSFMLSSLALIIVEESQHDDS